jgi:hypothetical protein
VGFAWALVTRGSAGTEVDARMEVTSSIRVPLRGACSYAEVGVLEG